MLGMRPKSIGKGRACGCSSTASSGARALAGTHDKVDNAPNNPKPLPPRANLDRRPW